MKGFKRAERLARILKMQEPGAPLKERIKIAKLRSSLFHVT